MIRAAALVVLLFALTACGGADFWAFESNTTGNGGATGFTFVAVWLSDSPVDGAEKMFVGVDRIEIEGADGVEVLSETRQVHDLLSLQNGQRVRLVDEGVPPGTYTLLRLTLAPEDDGVNRVLAGGSFYPLVFGGAESHVIELPLLQTNYVEDLRSDVQVDFNARLSVVEAGGTWILEPSTMIVDPDTSGIVLGRVVDELVVPVSLATVSAQQGGVERLSTRSRADGSFRLDPLSSGVYDLVVTAAGQAPTIVPAVLVTAGQANTVGDVELDDALPGAVEGVAPVGAGTSVRFFQNGALIGIAGVDPLTGQFVAPTLPPGVYSAELWGSAGPIDTDPAVVVMPSGVALVDFTT